MQRYLEVKISPLDDEQQDILIAWLSDEDFYSFQKTEDSLYAYILKDDFANVDLKKYVDENKEIELHEIEEKDWNHQWESDYQPVIYGDFLSVRADFQAHIDTTRYEIIITPKMSFGTGHHETTSLMVEQMRTMNFGEKTVIDFGTGTGILSILAEKMGAQTIFAIDKDEWSIANASENIVANHCSGIKIIQSDDLVEDLPQAEIVLANITANILIDHAQRLKEITQNEGFLVLAGFIQKDEQKILSVFADEHFVPVRKINQDSWVSISFRKLSIH